MKKLAIVFAGLAVTACVTGGYQPTYRFKQLQVVNLTGATVENVEVRVLESEKTLALIMEMCNDLVGDQMESPSAMLRKKRLRAASVSLSKSSSR